MEAVEQREQSNDGSCCALPSATQTGESPPEKAAARSDEHAPTEAAVPSEGVGPDPRIRTFRIGDDEITLAVDPELDAIVVRHLLASTEWDAYVDGLAPPPQLRTRLAVRTIHWYRRRVAVRLGVRCGFDPSCSRYAELAIRTHGVGRGTVLAVRRLSRCRSGTGGPDLPPGVALSPPTDQTS